MLGVDRLDYSKGIPDRIKAFERLLENSPEWRGKVTLLQVTPKSRSEIRQYGEIETEVTGLIGKVNGRFGDAAWTPIRYVNKSYSRTVLAGLYRAADVGMVTPLRDGMNLVAKEYLAAQNPDDPGVLVLSQFAGAAKELDGALIVNPHETDAVAAALKRALEMPLEERRERHAPMLEHLLENDIKKWARTIWRPWSAVSPRAVCSPAFARCSAARRTRRRSRSVVAQTPSFLSTSGCRPIAGRNSARRRRSRPAARARVRRAGVSLRSMSAAAAHSSRWSAVRVPGIGTTCGALASVQAIASVEGFTPQARASLR